MQYKIDRARALKAMYSASETLEILLAKASRLDKEKEDAAVKTLKEEEVAWREACKANDLLEEDYRRWKQKYDVCRQRLGKAFGTTLEDLEKLKAIKPPYIEFLRTYGQPAIRLFVHKSPPVAESLDWLKAKIKLFEIVEDSFVLTEEADAIRIREFESGEVEKQLTESVNGPYKDRIGWK